MILKVFDENGQLAHDCIEQGCDVSWDGYMIETGELVEGATGEIPAEYKVTGKTARLQPKGE